MAFVDGKVDLSGYPPAPVLWCTNLVDTVCQVLLCSDWRERLMGVTVSENDIRNNTANSNSWLSYKVPPIAPNVPDMLTFADFQQQQQQQQGTTMSMWESLYKYAFETSSTALGDLTTPTACWTLLVLVLMVRALKKTVLPWFRSMGVQAAQTTHGDAWIETNKVRIDKFGEYVFRLLYHSGISIYGLYYFWDKPWWSGNTLSLFRGFPHQPIPPGMAWYYLLQAAYNLDALVALLELSLQVTWRAPIVIINQQQQTVAVVDKNKENQKTTTTPTTTNNTTNTSWQFPVTIGWSQNVRGDFTEMLIHHIVTNLLVIGSSYCRLTRIGSMVFLVHDLSDVPVDLSKLANFVKWKATTIACFITMVLVWMATRLYVLPVTIYGAVLTQSHYVLEEGLSPLLYICYRHFFYVLVAFLILLHLAWFGMFLQIFWTLLRKNECHDLSEHKGGEPASSSSSSQQHKSVVANNNNKTKAKRRVVEQRYEHFDEKKDD